MGNVIDIKVIARDLATAVLKGAKNSVSNISGAVSKASKEFADFGQSVMKYGAVAGLAIGAVGVKAVTAFAGFEQSMSNISTLIDTNTESMQEMGDQVLELARNAPVEIGDLTSSLYDVRSAGIEAGSAMTVLESAMKLGVAGIGDTKGATDILTSSINAFGLNAKDADKISNVLFKTVKSGKTTVAELSQAFGATANTVAAAGFTLEDFSAAVAALTTTGMPASQAQNRLMQATVSLTRPTEDMARLFEKIGVEGLPEMIKQGMTMGDIFVALNEAAGGNAEVLTKAFGSVEAYGAAVSIAGEQNEAYTTTLEDMLSETNLLDEAYEKQKNTLSSFWKIVKNNVMVAVIKLGGAIAGKLTPYVKTAFEYVQDFFDLLSTGDFKEGMFGGAMEDSKIVSIVLDLRDGLIEVKKWWDENKDAIKKMMEQGMEKFIDGVTTLISWIKDNKDVVKTFVVTLLGLTALAGVVGLIVALVSAINPVVVAIVAIAAAVALVKKAWDKDFGGIKTWWDTKGRKMWEEVKEKVVDVAVKIKDELIEKLKDLKKWWDDNKEAVKDMLENAWNNLVDVAEDLSDKFTTLKDKIKELTDEGTILGDLISGIKDNFGKLKETIETKTGPTLQNLTTIFSTLGIVIKPINIFLGAMAVIITSALLIALNILLIALNGIIQAFSWLSEQAARVLEWMKKLPEEISKGWENIKQGAENLKNTIIRKWDEIKQGISTKWDEIRSNVSSKVDSVRNVVSTKFTQMKEGAISAGTGIVSWFRSLPAKISGFLSSLPGIAIEWINKMINAIKNIHIPLPHISSGDGYTIGIGPASVTVPTFSVEWYAKGIKGFAGGLAGINERGGEIVSLPSGSDIIPHDRSVIRAREQGQKEGMQASSGGGMNIENLNINLPAGNYDNETVVQMVVEKISELANVRGFNRVKA